MRSPPGGNWDHCQYGNFGISGGDERDEVVALLGLLETTEGHLGTGDELLGVLEVGELETRSD